MQSIGEYMISWPPGEKRPSEGQKGPEKASGRKGVLGDEKKKKKREKKRGEGQREWRECAPLFFSLAKPEKKNTTWGAKSQRSFSFRSAMTLEYLHTHSLLSRERRSSMVVSDLWP